MLKEKKKKERIIYSNDVINQEVNFLKISCLFPHMQIFFIPLCLHVRIDNDTLGGGGGGGGSFAAKHTLIFGFAVKTM